MRSIRVSLLVYFLGLLVVALTVASVLVYRTAQRTLEDKVEAIRNLIEAKYQELCQKERKRLDDELLEHAQALVGRVIVERDQPRLTHLRNPIPSADPKQPPIYISNSVHSLGAITAAFTPSGYLSVAPWAIQFQTFPTQQTDRGRPPGGRPAGGRPPGGPGRPTSEREQLPRAAFEIWCAYVADIKLNQHEFELLTDNRPDRLADYFYFQIDANNWGRPFRSIRSRSLGESSFPYPDDLVGKNSLHSETDDFELEPGHTVRRTRCKFSQVPVENRRGGRGNRPTPLPTTAPPLPAETARQPMFIVVQVATNMKKLAGALDQLRDDRNKQLDALESESIESLASLRNRLLIISSVTFTATVLGTWWLVWLGLLPLRRMTDAVSQVSSRDFRLPLGDSPLPLELRPIAERLTATLDQLKRAFAREKQSTADISHELRTPLAAMLTTIELSLRKARTPEQYREFLQDCRCSAQQMNQTVERLLALARLDAGVDRLRPQSVDAADLAEQCAAVVRPLAEAQGLRLSVSSASRNGDENVEQSADSSTRLTTDPDKLREVLNNLLHNAIQYNRPAGQIDLKVARHNGHVRLEVRDTGIGIAPESRDLIFERFYRADPSRTSDGMNAGLGLAIVKEYVELMGGRIDVDSALGQGSTFRVDLPATCAGSL